MTAERKSTLYFLLTFLAVFLYQVGLFAAVVLTANFGVPEVPAHALTLGDRLLWVVGAPMVTALMMLDVIGSFSSSSAYSSLAVAIVVAFLNTLLWTFLVRFVYQLLRKLYLHYAR